MADGTKQIEIDENLHRRAKASAALQSVTLQAWLNTAIAMWLEKCDKEA